MNRCFSYLCSRTQTNLDRSKKKLTNIPKDISKYQKSLLEINLQYNQITLLDQSIFKCKKLIKLFLNDNNIQEIPDEIGQLTQLEELHLSRNDICEVSEMIKNCENLLYIDLSSNNLQSIPEGITQIKSLQAIIINEVSLASIPSSISFLCNLRILEARDNLIQEIPESISFLSKLTRLDLGCNEITYLPETIGQLESLTELWLDANILAQLPTEIGDLKYLEILELSNNPIQHLPDSICNLEFLTDLTLSSNPLTELPENIGNLQELRILKLDFNQLRALPDSICRLKELSELYLSGNCLNSLPDKLGNLKSLRSLHLDYNQIMSLPDSICECESLSILSLRDNLVEFLPEEIGNLSKLAVFDLSGNKLQFMPFSISRLKKIKAIWLTKTQQKSLYPFQTDNNPQYGKVLVNFLLPQNASNSGNQSHGLKQDYQFLPMVSSKVERTSYDNLLKGIKEESTTEQEKIKQEKSTIITPVITISTDSKTDLRLNANENDTKLSQDLNVNAIQDFVTETVSFVIDDKHDHGIEIDDIDIKNTHLFGISDSSIYISKVANNSVEDNTSKLRVGDRVLEINGISTSLISAYDARTLLKIHDGTLRITVRHDPPACHFNMVGFVKTETREKLGLGVKLVQLSQESKIKLLKVFKIDANGLAANNKNIKVGSFIVEANGITLLNKNGEYFRKLIEDQNQITLIIYEKNL